MILIFPSKFLEFWEQWDWSNPKTQQQTLLLLFSVLGISIGFNFFLNPALEQRHQLRLQLQQFQQKERLQSSKIRPLSEEERSKLKQELRLLQQNIPEQRNNSQLIWDLSKQIQSSHLILKQQNFISEVLHQDYAEQTIQMNLEGQYLQLLDFLTKLEELPLLLKVQTLRIQNPDLTQQSPLLRIQLTLNTYRQHTAKE